MKILCRLGLHTYELRPIWTHKNGCSLMGKVCIHCNRIHPDDKYQRNALILYSAQQEVYKRK